MQQIFFVSARPSQCGSCYEDVCSGNSGIFPGGFGIGSGFGYGSSFGFGGLSGFGGGYFPQIPPPVSFLPVPQPVPIKIPSVKPASVTIPNIIVALLPPNNKPVCQPRPIIRPRPPVIPVPQPYPVPIRSGCDTECVCWLDLHQWSVTKSE